MIMKRSMKNKFVLVLAIQNVAFLTPKVLADEKKYTTKYDNIDIDYVIKNDRLLNGYTGCLLDLNACTPDAAELKKNLADALETDCAACSEAQKRIADKISHHLIDHRADQWKLLEQKYDPSGDYKRRYLDEKLQKKIDAFTN